MEEHVGKWEAGGDGVIKNTRETMLMKIRACALASRNLQELTSRDGSDG